MRDQRLDLQRRAAETSDDDLIPFGDRPTVSRFGAISRTSKTIYQGAGPMQAMAPQGAPTKSINISGNQRYSDFRGFIFTTANTAFSLFTISAVHNLQGQ